MSAVGTARFWATWGALLREGWAAVRAGGARLIGVLFAFQAISLLLAFPLIGWLFRQALRADGMTAVDLGALRPGGGVTITLGLLILISLLVFWLVALQFAVLVLLLSRLRRGVELAATDVLRDLGRVARKLLRPSSAPLVLYLFVLLPLTGFGFTTVFAQGIAVPPFVSGELMKSPTTAALLTAVFVALALLNVRLALTVPVFVLTEANGGRAMLASWRLTGFRASGALVGAVLTVMLLAALATLALVAATVLPTALSDELVPSASPVVAAFSLGAAQVLGSLLTSLVTAAVAAMLVVLLDRRSAAARLAFAPHATGGRTRLGGRSAALLVTGSVVLASLLLGAVDIPVMRKLAEQPQALVLAHRGFDGDGGPGGVENTIGGLEAAAEVGADLVEMDVMQTRDGRFIVMHDASLSRLAGIDAMVKDLAFDELVGTRVRDSAGNEGTIPGLADYVTRAGELGMPLLIEIKLGGADTPDHVSRLVGELEDLGALDDHIYHSLDPGSVSDLKRLRPDLTVGYTMAFAGAGAPDTPADFIVVEEWSASQDLQDAAGGEGLGFMVWTVDEETTMRELLRRGVDGLITDRPGAALDARASMQHETGLSNTLIDALTSFVVVF
ncbi:glycerophosphoryl diester phosphodiesterase membrane domain-containing protein [Leucobacter weissii]|uniref:Glycerophosphoryl diester phosphodiesterase membrane domain-containing protein n=1 Tax=Leucobacter weissii TaxID=1983706 RepID=A0A939SBV0_9MICO|nr:glycerophosphoryl diester phosphodiesterase membrane domain-containing protein [Leucobacter weissii]MBO1901723.1 glycerophosphoryl diester phosphodiesterase membrane domain-containing protein [Leucobacter weissii]